METQLQQDPGESNCDVESLLAGLLSDRKGRYCDTAILLRQGAGAQSYSTPATALNLITATLLAGDKFIQTLLEFCGES